jgi:penicillin-binding protein 1A
MDYKTSMFNRAVQSKRQPGSAIKPFLYQIGLNEGLNPASELADISRTYDYKVNGQKRRWQPKNYGGNFKGLLSLRESLMFSRNLSTINLVTDTGIDIVRDNLQKYGFKTIPNDLSITLGTMSVSPLEFSEYFSVFANNGTQVKPYIIEQITNNKGESIFFEPEYKEIDEPEQTYLITSILQDVINNGTARRAAVSGIELAGKTGTTNNNVDAWFAGYSPSIQTVVWFGKDDNKPMRKTETGGKIAAPAFAFFFKEYLALHPEIPRTFTKPSKVFVSTINGKTEYYTPKSPLPEIEIEIVPEDPNEEVMEF